MRLLIFFLLFSFVAAATKTGQRMLRRPVTQLAVCIVVAACFYSIRFAQ